MEPRWTILVILHTTISWTHLATNCPLKHVWLISFSFALQRVWEHPIGLEQDEIWTLSWDNSKTSHWKGHDLERNICQYENYGQLLHNILLHWKDSLNTPGQSPRILDNPHPGASIAPHQVSSYSFSYFSTSHLLLEPMVIAISPLLECNCQTKQTKQKQSVKMLETLRSFFLCCSKPEVTQ